MATRAKDKRKRLLVFGLLVVTIVLMLLKWKQWNSSGRIPTQENPFRPPERPLLQLFDSVPAPAVPSCAFACSCRFGTLCAVSALDGVAYGSMYPPRALLEPNAMGTCPRSVYAPLLMFPWCLLDVCVCTLGEGTHP